MHLVITTNLHWFTNTQMQERGTKISHSTIDPSNNTPNIVCGINDSAIQRHILAEVPLSLEKALQLAQGMETAACNVKELQGGHLNLCSMCRNSRRQRSISLFHLGPTDTISPYNVVVDVDGRPVAMEIDTGVEVSLMSAVIFEELWPVDLWTQLQCSCLPTRGRRSQ